jgi:hypothetical protein
MSPDQEDDAMTTKAMWMIAAQVLTVLEPPRKDGEAGKPVMNMRFTHDPNNAAIQRLRLEPADAKGSAIEIEFDARGEVRGTPVYQERDRTPFDRRPKGQLSAEEVAQLPPNERVQYNRDYWTPPAQQTSGEPKQAQPAPETSKQGQDKVDAGVDKKAEAA